jgi:cytochrome oxidase Cu insertion factor (SCO1/SenC/PrrC family)
MNSFVTAARNAGAAFTRRTRISWRMIIAAFALLIALFASYLAFRYLNYRNVQEDFYGQALVPASDAYDFHLIDQNGKAFQLSQLRGKVVIFYFGFTHCPNICPTTLTDLEKVYRALPDKARRRVQVIFVTIDPERDNPELMKKYISYFDPDFLGLTRKCVWPKFAAGRYRRRVPLERIAKVVGVQLERAIACLNGGVREEPLHLGLLFSKRRVRIAASRC